MVLRKHIFHLALIALLAGWPGLVKADTVLVGDSSFAGLGVLRLDITWSGGLPSVAQSTLAAAGNADGFAIDRSSATDPNIHFSQYDAWRVGQTTLGAFDLAGPDYMTGIGYRDLTFDGYAIWAITDSGASGIQIDKIASPNNIMSHSQLDWMAGGGLAGGIAFGSNGLVNGLYVSLGVLGGDLLFLHDYIFDVIPVPGGTTGNFLALGLGYSFDTGLLYVGQGDPNGINPGELWAYDSTGVTLGTAGAWAQVTGQGVLTDARYPYGVEAISSLGSYPIADPRFNPIVPEPGTYLLMGGALLALGTVYRRRRRA